MSVLSRFAAAALLALAPPALAAEPTDVADVFPAGTLAFAELHKPAEVAPQLAALFKGTPLDDGLAFIHNRRDKTTNIEDLQGKPELALAGLLASPEMLAELKRVRGVGVGLTGFTDLGMPEAALAVLTADTPAVGLAARAFLTMDPSVRKVGVVGTVPVYQLRSPSMVHDNLTGVAKLANEKPPVEGPHEPTFAYLPGLVVVGTSKKAVAGVVARFQGTAKDSLLGTPLFQEAAAGHRRAGLFYFVNAPAFAAAFEAAGKAGKNENLAGADLVAWGKMLAGGKALRSVAGSAAFRDNGLSLRAAAAFEAGQRSPLFDFLAVPGVTAELLRHAPRPATFAAAVALPAANRSAAVLSFLDSLAKANGELGRLPAEAVRELEAKYKTSIAAGLIDKTAAVAVVLPARQELPTGATPLPTLVLHCESADVAAAYSAFAPKLIADLGGAAAPPEPSSETIGGVKVFSLPGTGLPWKAAVHFAHNDARFAVGLDRKLVAAALVGEPGGVVAAPADAVVLLGTVALGRAVRAATEARVAAGPVVPLPVELRSNEPLPPEKLVADLAKARRDFFAATDALPPATLTARRAGQELRFELFQPNVQGGGLSPVVTAAVGWFDTVRDLGGPQSGNGPSGRFGRRRGG